MRHQDGTMEQTVGLHAEAPPKPPWGSPCTGCGVCCAAEPCPVGMIVFRRRRGPCPALAWAPQERRYHCRLARNPAKALPWLPARWESLAARLFARWIAAGRGCDSTAEVLD